MTHLVIGAIQAPHIREYARSVELATSVRPHVLSWGALGGGAALPPLAPGPLLVRLAAPIEEEIATLVALGGGRAGGADVETAPAGFAGLFGALGWLERALADRGVRPCFSTAPRTLATLLDQELRAHCLARDGTPVSPLWTEERGGAHVAYEALRERLRRSPGTRAQVRLRRSLGDVPTVVVWMGARGIRAQANCRFTPSGAARGPLHPIEDEVALRPLLGRFFELGAVVQEEFPGAEIGGHPFSLSMLVCGDRVVLGHVGPGGAFRRRWAPPEAGVPADLSIFRRQIAAELFERIEETCVRLCRIYRCAGLVVDVALSRRFDDFRVIDVDPFGEAPADRRDALGWGGADHLVRGLRDLAGEDEAPAQPAL